MTSSYQAPPAWNFSPPPKRKVFVSYHHGTPGFPGDQEWADYFMRLFSEVYDVLFDRSLRNPIDSDNLDYVHRVIREDYITGSSVTVLLCGANTLKRKCVDWEVYSTLQKRHGLLGIRLPSAMADTDGQVPVLARYFDNWRIGYAPWIPWTTDADGLKSALEDAIGRAQRIQPDNSRPRMTRNLA